MLRNHTANIYHIIYHMLLLNFLYKRLIAICVIIEEIFALIRRDKTINKCFNLKHTWN